MDNISLIDNDLIRTIALVLTIGFLIYEFLFRRGLPGNYYEIGIPLFRRQSPLTQKWFSLSTESINQHQLETAEKTKALYLKLYEIDENRYGLRIEPIPSKYRKGEILLSMLIGLIGPSEDSQMLIMQARLSLLPFGVILFPAGVLILINWIFAIMYLMFFGVVMVIACLYARRDFLDFWDTLQDLDYRQDQ